MNDVQTIRPMSAIRRDETLEAYRTAIRLVKVLADELGIKHCPFCKKEGIGCIHLETQSQYVASGR
jgi:hypothetical protein